MKPSAEELKARRRLRAAAMRYANAVVDSRINYAEFDKADDNLLRAARDYGRIVELMEKK